MRWCLLLLAMVGCAAKKMPAESASAPAPAPAPTTKPIVQRPRPRQAFASLQMTRGETMTAIRVDIYQLSVPYGTVSRNEKFWKRIDEQCVDFETYDLLFKNGIRVGEARTAEWEHFKKIMDEHPAVTRTNTLITLEGKTVELPMRKEVDRQDIFYLDNANILHGRSYDSSENVVNMVLQPAPRSPDSVRLSLCPVVRSMRKRLEYTSLNNEQEIAYTTPEHLYNLNLIADIPIESFFVVAPSGEATWPTSVGNSFFVRNGAAEQLETVLLLVPRAVQMEVAPATSQPAK